MFGNKSASQSFTASAGDDGQMLHGILMYLYSIVSFQLETTQEIASQICTGLQFCRHKLLRYSTQMEEYQEGWMQSKSLKKSDLPMTR